MGTCQGFIWGLIDGKLRPAWFQNPDYKGGLTQPIGVATTITKL